MTDKEIEVIVKPIFTKMFNANFSVCEYGIECYKKGMEYQGIKELAIENENLIKRVRKLEEQIEKMKCCENCKHYNAYITVNEEIGNMCEVYYNGCNNSTYAPFNSWEIKENE